MVLEIGLSVVDWIGLAQDRYRWRALVNSVMNFGFHKILGSYRVAAQLVASRVVLSSTELVKAMSHVVLIITIWTVLDQPMMSILGKVDLHVSKHIIGRDVFYTLLRSPSICGKVRAKNFTNIQYIEHCTIN
jgi:hypothetical protein